MTSSDKLTWSAAIFDSNGTIGMYPKPKTTMATDGRLYHMQLRCELTSRPTLEILNASFGVGRMPSRSRVGRRTSWTWSCNARNEVIRLLNRVKPYLVERAHEAELALELLENDLTPAQQHIIYEAMRRSKVRPRRPPPIMPPSDRHRRAPASRECTVLRWPAA